MIRGNLEAGGCLEDMHESKDRKLHQDIDGGSGRFDSAMALSRGP